MKLPIVKKSPNFSSDKLGQAQDETPQVLPEHVLISYIP